MFHKSEGTILGPFMNKRLRDLARLTKELHEDENRSVPDCKEIEAVIETIRAQERKIDIRRKLKKQKRL